MGGEWAGGGDHQGNRILTEKNQGGWVLIFFVGINARENQLGSLFFGGKTRRERGGGDHLWNRILTLAPSAG